MTIQPELTALLERVEKASGPDRELDNLLAFWFTGAPFWIAEWGEEYEKRPWLAKELCGEEKDTPPPHFTASLDAAIALVERVLPEHQVEMMTGVGGFYPQARIYRLGDEGGPWICPGGPLTIAVLCALLRSLIQEGEKQ